MRKTDINKIRELALAFVYSPIEPSAKIPFLVSHPYTDSAFIAGSNEDGSLRAVNLLEDEDGRHQFEEKLVQQIKTVDAAIGFFLMLCKAYQFTFLDHIKSFLSNDDLAVCLRYAWVHCEFTNSGSVFTKKKLVSLFRRSTKERLMDEEELAVFQDLPERITVYRGTTSINSEDIKVFSWTLSLENAEWFASRFNGEQQNVFQAELPKEGALAYFSSEEEIIANPFMLENIRELKYQPRAGAE